MSFWIAFPFWMMLVLLIANTLLVKRFSNKMSDSDDQAENSEHS